MLLTTLNFMVSLKLSLLRCGIIANHSLYSILGESISKGQGAATGGPGASPSQTAVTAGKK